MACVACSEGTSVAISAQLSCSACAPGKFANVTGLSTCFPCPTGTKQAEDAPSQLQVVWKSTRNVPNKPSLLLVDDLLFMIDDAGIASCVEAKTGDAIWRERIGGDCSASPVYADGRGSEEGSLDSP